MRICKLHKEHISYFILILKLVLSTENTFETQTATTHLSLTCITLSTYLSLKIKIEDNYLCWFCTNEFSLQVYFDVKIKQFCLKGTRLKDLWVLKNRCNWIYHLMKYLIHIFARVSILKYELAIWNLYFCNTIEKISFPSIIDRHGKRE